jgi:transketolase
MSIEPLDKKYEAFGFKTIGCNGNDMSELDKALAEAWTEKEKPVCIIAKTEKGFGVKRFQGTVEWHYGAMDIEMYKEALADIEAL